MAWRKAVAEGKTRTASDMIDGEDNHVYRHSVSRSKIVKVTYYATDSDTLSWKLDKGGWKISRLPVIKFDNSTPLSAVKTFYLSVYYGKWVLVHRLLPGSLSVRLTLQDVATALNPDLPRTKRFLSELKKSMDSAPIFVKGDTAYYYYGESKVLTLKREEDGWHVESPY